MKTIKVLISASEEMYDEKLAFTDVMTALNKALAPRGVELERIKWNPDTDGTIEDFRAKLSECEMCLTLYWNELAGNSEGELNAAYQDLKEGRNPRQLYVFFKEPSAEISDELRDFKANFVTQYGHFFCKFENVDTMNLQFVLQFEAYHNRQNSSQEKVITIKNGMLNVGDTKVLNLSNVPFSAMNKECQRLQKELAELDEQFAVARAKHMADPEDEEAEETYFVLRSKRKKLLEEFDKYEEHLYDIALNFAKLDESRYSDRIRRAKEEFEKGNVVAADEILNMEEMKREKEREMQQYEQHRHNLELKIEEFRLKAETVMANTEYAIPERFAQACEAYEQAIDIAKAIHYDEVELAAIFFGYAYLLQEYHKNKDAIQAYESSSQILRSLINYAELLACSLINTGVLKVQLHQYRDAELDYKEAFDIFQNDANMATKYEDKIALILGNWANLQCMMEDWQSAEKKYTQAIKIYRQLSSGESRKYDSDLCWILERYSSMLYSIGRDVEADQYSEESLKICRKLATEDTKEEVNLARTLMNVAFFQRARKGDKYATKLYTEALTIIRRYATIDPYKYNHFLARCLFLLGQLKAEAGSKKGDVMLKESYRLYQQLSIGNPASYTNYVQSLDDYFTGLISPSDLLYYAMRK